MKKKASELTIGDRFVSVRSTYVCIRMYGEHQNILAIRELDKKIVKFPKHSMCDVVEPLEVGLVPAGALDVNDIIRMPDNAVNRFEHETFQILEIDDELGIVRCKVLETGLITTLNPYADVKVLTHGNS